MSLRLLTRRFASTCKSHIPHQPSLARITQYYISTGDDPASASSLAEQELRWLTEAAQGDTLDLGRMVDELVVLHKPMAYILGVSFPFYCNSQRSPYNQSKPGDQPFVPLPLPLLVKRPTLVPRPETEYWVSQLSQLLPASQRTRLLDIGTGTACIPLALTYNKPLHTAIAVDVIPSALQLARENTLRFAMENRVRIVAGDVFETSFAEKMRELEAGGFDVVISNPPYITRKAYETLAPSVKEWEDRCALVGTAGGEDHDEANADDGLKYYRRICSLLPRLLARGSTTVPAVVFEIGEGQAEAVRQLIEEQGMRVQVWKDQWEIERVVLGYRTS